ncbi:apolipoprotein D-like [Varroa jacobsoni]|uniref:Lipocalin/cytosolic fatty-acid binding domain-containing protein n=1 Tax=Varroa destructor TaxID=109461 RepID=A0A7M7KAG2_VARDE|nr:apolipoprotein D-like [Varroa destructor]XP_022700352.1 apolipoprotein D-like [Varroa jacobsoni]
MRAHCIGAVCIFLHLFSDTLGKKIIPMENFDPEKIQGTWFVIRRNTKLFDSIKCIKYNLKHDPNIDDIYSMTSYWINSAGEYVETQFNIVDDRALKSRFFFESTQEKIAVNVLGTDYTNWMVGFGVNGPKETYYVSTRTKSLPPDSQDAINEILKKNEVEQDWADVEQVACPDTH